MEMGFSSFKFIFGICIILFVFVVSEQTIFECYGDACNVRKVHQFCSSTFKYCRDCHEIKEDCGTAAQPLNCTAYCQEIAVAEALKQMRERVEKSCLVVPVMLNIANGNVAVPQQNDSRIPAGSELVYSCHNGYTLKGPSTLKCIGNGTWEPTAMPYCFDNALIGTCTDFRHSTIALSIICFIGLTAMIFVCVCYKMKRNKRNISRTSTNSSLSKDEEPLIEAKSQRLHLENERPTVPIGPSGFEDSTPEATKTVTPPALPSAPPVESNKEEDEAGQGPANKSRSSSDVPRGIVVVNNQVQVIFDNTPRSPEAHGNFKDNTRNDNFPYDPTRMNQRSIDEKMPTEETDEVNAVEETTDEKKGRGTKPLPARDEDSHTRAESTRDHIEAKEATYKGPQPVPAAKEESIQTPTKETAGGNTLDMVGIQDITFPKNDIKSNKTKLTGKSEDHNFTQGLAALKEA